MNKVSVLIPVYNEEESLVELHARVVENLEAIERDFEILFVDDGSTDTSWAVIEDLSQKDSRVRAIKFRRNFGKSEALAAGFNILDGDIIFTMDADLQDDPKEFPEFIKMIESGYDVVSGWKKERHDPLEKRLPSKLFNGVTSKLSGVKLHDFNCGFKCYKRAVIKEINVYGERHRFIPVLAHQRGFKIGELVVQHHARKHGVSKFGWERYLRGMLDLMTLTFLTSYAKRPSHFFGGFGLFCGSLGILIDLYILGLKLVTGEIYPRYPLMYLGILLTVVGAQFITFGLIAELLVSRSKEEHVKGYSIDKNI